MNNTSRNGDGSADPGPPWPWAARLGDLGRAAAALALAAEALQRRVEGPVVKDRVAGRLTATGPSPQGQAATIVLSLESLAGLLGGEPVHRWPQLVTAFVDAALEANRRIAGSRFGRWEVARSRLLIRAVRRCDGGPLSRPFGPGLSLDVGISAGPVAAPGPSGPGHSMLIVIGTDLVERWGRPAEEVYGVARANTLRLVRPEPAKPSGLPGPPHRAGAPGPGRLRAVVLRGGPWTTGVLVDPFHFLVRAGLPPVPARDRLWISALDPAAVLIVTGSADRSRVVEQLVDDWFDRHRDGFPRNLRPVGRPR